MKLLKKGRVILFSLLSILALYSTYLFLTVGQVGHDTVLVVLAQEFLKKNVALPIYNLPVRDISNYFNNYYVYFGPLSSILLVPFVFVFGERVPQVSIGIFSMITSFAAVYYIAKHFKFSNIDSLWLALFLVFSTVLFSSSVINITAYQVEALGVPFILLSLLAYFKKKNGLLIGLFIALALLTRVTLILAVAFFFIEVLQRRFTLRQFILLLIPIFLSLSLLGLYNMQRFHSVFETGYEYTISKTDPPIGLNFKYGEMSVSHIPANLYSFLIMSPEPLLMEGSGMVLKFPYLKANPWGIAIWYTSPLFLYLVLRFKRGTYTLSAGVTALLLAVPVFLWYSIGYAQFGYRYALDFLPFLFLLLLYSLTPRLSKTALILITLGVIFNCVYTDSIWEMYPLFSIYPK
jgi:hypothetical protein